MLNFILKRLLSSLWTLILVIIVSFLLIQLAPGDKAEAILNLQGISIGDDENSNFYEEYEVLRSSYGLDQPWFYFSLIPDFRNKSYPDQWRGRHRNLADKLLKSKIPFENVTHYVNTLKILESHCQSVGDNNCLRQTRFLNEMKELDIIDQRLSQLSDLSIEGRTGLLVKDLEQARLGLINKVGIYFPVIKWNGLQNQFHDRFSRIIKLDFGNSVLDGQPVGMKITSALGWTILLTVATLLFSLLIGIPLSIASVRSNEWVKRIIGISMNIFYAIPVFWLATLLILFFTTPEYGRWTDVFPSPVFRPGNDDFWSSMVNNGNMILLPVLCLVLSSLPVIVRITRRSIISESIEPYVTALKAKGLEDNSIYKKHIIPNALIPVVTMISNSLPSAMAGTLVVEVIFNIPGMGRLMYSSISNYDWDVCFAVIIMMSVVTSIVFLIADIFYYRLNPKMSIS